MLLLDSLFVNNGGGKQLLDLLIPELNKYNNDVIYLFDERNIGQYDFLKKENVYYLRPSLILRHYFYIKNKEKITSVLAFGNVPPTVSLKIPVFTYFHNISFLENKTSFLIKFKSYILWFFRNNTSFWLVQTQHVKSKLSGYWNILDSNILVLPFYNDNISKSIFNPKSAIEGINFTYISDGHYYKNHKRLIEAFVIYNKKFPKSSLTLTIGDNFFDLKSQILNAIQNDVNIIDKGIIKFDKVLEVLSNSDVIIYPSLFESFGLGLVESALLGLPILSSDLPYVFEVIIPNYVFDPLSVDSIYKAFLEAHNFLHHGSELVVENKINKIIELISK
jgi:glycosyltransferase involved in cell wall biosynthesis